MKDIIDNFKNTLENYCNGVKEIEIPVERKI